MKRIQILKPGTFRGTDGKPVTLTGTDLADLASGYDPSRHEAPIVVGHPKLNGPAKGWVAKLDYDPVTERVNATPRKVLAEFASSVQAEDFKKVSASLWPPEHPDNPTPGRWALRHVGFLGAHVPAVLGLDPVQFGSAAAEEEGGTVVVDFGSVGEAVGTVSFTLSRFMRGVREWLIGKNGNTEDADQVAPDWMIRDAESAERDARQAAQQAVTGLSFNGQPIGQALPSFAATADGAVAPTDSPTQEETVSQTQDETAVRAAALDAREADLTAREQAIKDQETAAADRARESATAEFGGFVDGLIAAGKILPAERERLVELGLSIEGTATVDFGAGDGKATLTPRAALQEFLGGLPERVPMGTVVKTTKVVTETTDFGALPHGHVLDPEGLELHHRVKAHQGEHKVTYDAALSAVLAADKK